MVSNRRARLPELVRFVFVGGISFAIDFGMLVLLQEVFGLKSVANGVLISAAVAYGVGPRKAAVKIHMVANVANRLPHFCVFGRAKDHDSKMEDELFNSLRGAASESRTGRTTIFYLAKFRVLRAESENVILRTSLYGMVVILLQE